MKKAKVICVNGWFVVEYDTVVGLCESITAKLSTEHKLYGAVMEIDWLNGTKQSVKG